MGQHRSTQRHPAKVASIEEAKLRHRLREVAAEHIRWGRRMAYRLLRREGWSVNHKRVQRLWREEGLQRPTPRKRKRARPADGSVRRHRAEHPHQVWAMDFQFDATADGRRLKFLNVIDEHSRLCLAIRVGRRCKATDVVAVLEELTSLYPAPTFIRSDNGPEFIAQALQLRHASRLSRAEQPGTVQALESLAEAGILSAEAARELVAAHDFLSRCLFSLRLAHNRQTDEWPRGDTPESREVARLRPRVRSLFNQWVGA